MCLSAAYARILQRSSSSLVPGLAGKMQCPYGVGNIWWKSSFCCSRNRTNGGHWNPTGSRRPPQCCPGGMDAGTFSMNQRLTNMMRQYLLDIGLTIFQDLRGKYSWGQINHVGFRPFNLLGFENASKVWIDACTRMVSKWRHGAIHDGFLCFPKVPCH